MISLIVVDDSLLWFTGTTRMLFTDFVPNLVIFPLILAQCALALVSLFPYLKSHWAQNSKCSCLSVVIYCITECWSGLWSRIFVAFKHTASSSSSTSFFVPVFIYTLAFPDWSLSTHLGDDPVARPDERAIYLSSGNTGIRIRVPESEYACWLTTPCQNIGATG